MPLGDFEREVLRVIAVNRNPDSFVGGATVLHQSKESPRSSQDIDLFHDTQEIITQAYEADVKALRQNGFEIDRVGMQQGFYRALARRGGSLQRSSGCTIAPFDFFQ